MALDGITATALCEELDQKLTGARVVKIMQPDRYTVVLTLYTGQRQEQLTISANPSLPTIYLGRPNQPNPKQAPSFCMMLRKYLQGATLESIETPPYERVFILRFQVLDEYHDLVEKCLIAELIQRRTNLILTNDKGTIHNAVIHVDHSINRVREILPAHPYQLPPPLDKLKPEDWLEQKETLGLFPTRLNNLKLEKALLALILGLSPFPARAIVQSTGLDPRLQLKDLTDLQLARLAQALTTEMEKVVGRHWQPTLYFSTPQDTVPLDFYALELPTPLHKVTISSVAEAMTLYSNAQRESNRLEQKRQHLRKIITQELEATSRKAELHRQEMSEGQKADKYQLYGELILANLRQYYPNAKSMLATNYYDSEQKQIDILLQEDLSTGPANAERYFRLADKAKSKYRISSRLLAKDKQDLDWLTSLQVAVENAGEIDDLDALADEYKHYRRLKKSADKSQLWSTASKKTGFKNQSTSGSKRDLNPGKPGKKRPYQMTKSGAKKHKKSFRKEDKPLPPRRYLSSDGLIITVGRNNIQNDRLTLRQAARNDLWLHVKNAPGTHVIVSKGESEFPSRTIEEAAGIAAWFSRKAGSQAKVEVDYCPVRNVKKPRGAHPGHVVYEDYRTIIIEPLDPTELSRP